ncbi:Nuclear pore complex protein NUP35 [Hibiscus syriacus]|uniref:Nuclear pore complex protein NUP35 n=2 Tax=Hibiscus syriacus TaxID=106335 RepID=A0A6A2YN25_HIBSY|nr:Nuclear pore complex protein NUP35 [Hibiscus syriacus]
MYTLEDRADFPPESGGLDYPISPEVKSDPRTRIQSSGHDFSTPAKSKSGGSSTFAVLNGQQSAASSSWWSPEGNGSGQDDKGKGSPAEGMAQSGALITLLPPKQVARPEIQNNSIPAGNLDGEDWVTVFGFSPADTKLVLREFEKCGVILKYVPGPRDANWMHILYSKGSDAQRALGKNGMQINGVLIIGVKPVDPMHRETLNERLNNQGFMTLSSTSSRKLESNNFQPPRTYHLLNGNANAQQSGGPLANPTRSLGNKVMEYLFGF